MLIPDGDREVVKGRGMGNPWGVMGRGTAGRGPINSKLQEAVEDILGVTPEKESRESAH
ncbi:hypothetical protein PISMIDRAFT_12170 [Pisolithus microcarpus 441]|uniref:Uncharacterized protein n=1 Tax=Pisolithus microcarpus 441 TaxID=765257 RepID=A0A0C9YAC8_9AGAM|nr:hypothetical protein PISMIDRAFT_12170 [Pisolithus microcarpus 441]